MNKMSAPRLSALSFSLLLLFSLSLPSPSLSVGHCNPNDERVLLKMKKVLNNPRAWESWTPKTDCCTWFFVLCDDKTHRVNNLGFADMASGFIPPIVGDLPFLETLQLTNVQNFTGGIPTEIGKLKRLKYLFLEDANLTGSIPPVLGELKYLKSLLLSSNQLTGQIPSSLSKLSRIENIKLDNNKLTGQIPESFGNFTRSRGPLINVAHNQLSGPIPRSLASATISIIDFSDNFFEGDASFLFGADKKHLALANLSRNAFEFDLSNVGFPRIMGWLDLSHNKLYGSLPAGLAKLNLREFDVSYNQLCGPIPVSNYLQGFGPSAYSHNRCLCGAPLPPCK